MSSPTAQSGRVRLTPYDVVRSVLGVLLLTAAALKVHQLATEPLAETSLLTSRWFLIGVVEFELFSSLWLFSGASSATYLAGGDTLLHRFRLYVRDPRPAGAPAAKAAAPGSTGFEDRRFAWSTGRAAQ